MDIKTLRSRIDRVDIKVLRLLKKRFKLSKQIKHIKNKEGLEIEDKTREEELFKSLSKSAKKFNLDPELVKKIYNLILEESKKIQKGN